MIAAANVRGGGGAADAERLEQALREAFEVRRRGAAALHS